MVVGAGDRVCVSMAPGVLVWIMPRQQQQTSMFIQQLILAPTQKPLQCAHAGCVLAPHTRSSRGLACVQVGAPRWLACIVTTWGLTAMAFAFSKCRTTPFPEHGHVLCRL